MAFRLVTLNLNGIRSAANKGFVEWAALAGADCMGVQEVKAQADDITGRFERNDVTRFTSGYTSLLPTEKAKPKRRAAK